MVVGGSGTESLLKCSIECGVAGTAIATSTSMLNDGAASLMLKTTRKAVTDRMWGVGGRGWVGDRKFVKMQY